MAPDRVQPRVPAAGGSRLARILGARDAVAIMVSNMVGVGILTLPGLVAVSFGSTALALAAWAAGGALSLAGALVHAELGSRYPRAGGDYVFLRRAFGRPAAFLSGWTSLVVGLPGAIAAATMAAAVSLAEACGLEGSRWRELGLSVLLVLALSLLHASGLRQGKWLQNVLTILKVAVVLALVVAGWVLPAQAPGNLAAPDSGAPPASTGALIIFFAYSGWNASAYMAGEIREPRRDLPRALAGGVVVVTLLYLAVNLTYFRVVPPADLGRSINLGGEVAARVLGSAGGRALSAALAFVFLGTASAMVLTGPRIYYAMARDGTFPRALARLGPRSRVPVRALWLQSFWAAALLVLGTLLAAPGEGIPSTFEKVVSWTSFAFLPFAALTAGAVFVFRRRDRRLGTGAPFATPGYPWTALCFIAAAAAVEVTFLAARENHEEAAIGSLLVASGVPAYLLLGRRRVSRARAPRRP